MITSNFKGNKDLMEGLTEAHIPCFVRRGTIFMIIIKPLDIREHFGTFDWDAGRKLS